MQNDLILDSDQTSWFMTILGSIAYGSSIVTFILPILKMLDNEIPSGSFSFKILPLDLAYCLSMLIYGILDNSYIIKVTYFSGGIINFIIISLFFIFYENDRKFHAGFLGILLSVLLVLYVLLVHIIGSYWLAGFISMIFGVFYIYPYHKIVIFIFNIRNLFQFQKDLVK